MLPKSVGLSSCRTIEPSDHRYAPVDLRLRPHITYCGCLVFRLEKLTLAKIDLKKTNVFDV